MAAKIVIPMITPHKNGSLDTDALDGLIHYAVSNRFDGLFAASSTGGCASLSYREHLGVLREVIERAGETELFANISRNSLGDSLDMMKDAEDLGYRKGVIINPYYHRYSQASIERYFGDIASNAGMEIYLYNNPALSGLTITPETVRKLASEYSGIAGIKDSGGDLDRFREFLDIRGLKVYQGKDHLLRESIGMGAYGGVCSTSNFSANTLHVAHDQGNTSRFAQNIYRVTEVMKMHEVPAFHNYMFRRFVLCEDHPVQYMNRPFGDLESPPADATVSGII